MAAFSFELVSPESLLFSGEVEAVQVPGSEGDMTVLAQHAPLITTLRPGLIGVQERPGSEVRRIFVRGGLADISQTRVTILAEQAVPVEEMTAERLAGEVEAAQQGVASASTDEARSRAQERLGQMQGVQTMMRNA